MPAGEALAETRQLVNGLRLNTVCVEARCPNLTDCWSRHIATFMILGDKCTRRCRFCAVTTARPDPPDEGEPQRLAEAAEHLRLRHVVITSVARDDLPDEGAGHFARCVRAVAARLPAATVEVLVPDFHARPECVQAVADAGPQVLNHNVETVPSLHKRVRPQAKYARSLETLRVAKRAGLGQPLPEGNRRGRGGRGGDEGTLPRPLPEREGCYQAGALEPRATLLTKSGVMVGLGETRDELMQVFRDLRSIGCDLLTIGQYLKPSSGDGHVPVERFYTPEEFDELGAAARELGFAGVASGPFVRSSYFAETLYAGTTAHGGEANPGSDKVIR